ncbi:MAG: helix-turn-helix domain-containing protein [Coriobacteriaceae bacterium]|nr:helix-turn-helix domain-containing protein [Coriobacteriaceae bacterium]
MEVGKNIRQYRSNLSLSQDELAEKVFVSRQTISNWENGRSYPDVHSLILLCTIFDVSLDQLVKGDVSIMKEQLSEHDRRKFGHLSMVYSVLFILLVITPLPLVHYLKALGLGIWCAIAIAAAIAVVRVERYKTRFDMQTYRELVAFSEGKSLTAIEKAREKGKRPYQSVAYMLVCGVATALVNLAIIFFLRQ